MRKGSTCRKSSTGSGRSRSSLADDLLSVREDCLQMPLVLEAFGINLVDSFGTRQAGREPAIAGAHFEPADRGVVPRVARHLSDDRIAGQVRRPHRLGRQLLELGLLL